MLQWVFAKSQQNFKAVVVELVDTLLSGSSADFGVEVQVLSTAPVKRLKFDSIS